MKTLSASWTGRERFRKLSPSKQSSPPTLSTQFYRRACRTFFPRQAILVRLDKEVVGQASCRRLFLDAVGAGPKFDPHQELYLRSHSQAAFASRRIVCGGCHERIAHAPKIDEAAFLRNLLHGMTGLLDHQAGGHAPDHADGGCGNARADPDLEREFLGPMAYAMMGGIVVVTLLTLLFLPFILPGFAFPVTAHSTTRSDVCR
ncbi:hypothetical protein FHT70_005940 [Rhizobium sp. BK049]|nr:hypothetical protein [Rhizobium sp. BK049]